MDKGTIDKAMKAAKNTEAMTSVMNLALREFDMIHALCDRANVPRIFEGEKLSAAQRVTILEGSWRGLMCSYRGAPPRAVEH